MAEKLNLPKQVINSDWKEGVDVDYAIYGDNEKEEREYIQPSSVEADPEAIERIKQFQVKLATNSLKRFRNQEQKLAA